MAIKVYIIFLNKRLPAENVRQEPLFQECSNKTEVLTNFQLILMDYERTNDQNASTVF